MFIVLVVDPIFIVLVVAPIFVVLKAPRLYLSLIALYRVSKEIKFMGGILDAVYSPFNKLLT